MNIAWLSQKVMHLVVNVLCNAGKNYLVFKPDGQAFRCQCHMDTPLGDMNNISEWIPNIDLSCPIMSECKRNHPEEWNMASRLDDCGNIAEQGTMAGQPYSEVVTRISLVGDKLRSPEEWCSLFDLLAKHYKKCWHRIEGGDPSEFQGIAQLIDKISFLGDHLFYVTDLSSKTTRIVDVLAKATVDCIQFIAIINPTTHGFNEIKTLGRLRLIHERGFRVSVVMPGNLGTFYFFEPFFEKISNRYGIPMAFLPETEFPKHMKERLASIMAMSDHSKFQRKEDTCFSGL
jgi:hypothetical protein